MELNIISLTHKDNENISDQYKCPIFNLSIHYGTDLLKTVPYKVEDGKLSVSIPEVSTHTCNHLPYLEFRFTSAIHKKQVCYLRLFISKSIEEPKMRTLISSKLTFELCFTWKSDMNHTPKPEILLCSWLGGAYPHLFSASSSLSSSSVPSSSSSLFPSSSFQGPARTSLSSTIFQPPNNAYEIVLWSRECVIFPTFSDQETDIEYPDEMGALVLTNLRLMYIPGFLNINPLIESIMGNDEEKKIEDLVTYFKEKSNLENMINVEVMDLNGDGMLSKSELSTFLTDNIVKLQCHSQVIQMPVSNIASLKLSHRKETKRDIIQQSSSAAASSSSSAFHRSASALTDNTPSLKSPYFSAGLLEVNIPSFTTSTGNGSPYVIYTIEVSAPQHLIKPIRGDEEDETSGEGGGRTWTVEHRYRDFDALRHNLLAETVGTATLPVLPKKHLFKSAESNESRRLGLCSFLKELLDIETARSNTLASFLDATSVLAEIENEQQEADDEEMMSMLSPARRTALALLAENTPLRPMLKRAGSEKEMYVESKTGINVKFVVPSTPDLSSELWCDAVQSEVDWLVEEREFQNAFSHLAVKKQSRDASNERGGGAEEVNSSFLPNEEHVMAREYRRLGVPSEDWRIVDNENFEFCSTYPAVFAVPYSVSDEVLVGSSEQRCRHRIPALTWLHPDTKAPLCRSSQPLAGLQGINQHHLKLDVEFLVKLRENVPGAAIKIFDARPKLNASANALNGKGFEDVSDIPGAAEIAFLNIDNIHTMRHSFALLSAACVTEQDNFHELVTASKWLNHLKMVLRGSLLLALSLESGAATLVHCSDGWDRTSQLSAISQLLLDPYYRTMEGYNTLIEKDFCSFGHKFASRGSANTRRFSPIFIQFLDVTWQLQRQFPRAFQFNEQYLIAIADGFYSNWANTFIGDCEKDRKFTKSSNHSIWDLIKGKQFENVHYDVDAVSTTPSSSSSSSSSTSENSRRSVKFLQPKFSMQALQFWSNLYLRYNYHVFASGNYHVFSSN